MLKTFITAATIATAALTTGLIAGAANAAQLELLNNNSNAELRELPRDFNPDKISRRYINDFLNGRPLDNSKDRKSPFDLTRRNTDILVYETDARDAQEKVATDGLNINFDGASDVTIRFTYLGSEAGFQNFGVGLGDDNTVIFDNKRTQLGDSAEVTFNLTDTGHLLLPFFFETTGTGGNDGQIGDAGNERAANNGSIDGDLELAFLQTMTGDLFTNILGVENGSTIALFGDGTGDSDLDDLIIGIGVVGIGATVSAVPVPAALPLMLSGLAGIGLMGWRKKKMA